MIVVQEHPEGCVLAVRAQPGARKTRIVGEQAGALKIAVTAPPEDGRANRALCDVLREAFSLKRSDVELLHGASARDKRILLRGLSRHELQRQLENLLGARKVSDPKKAK